MLGGVPPPAGVGVGGPSRVGVVCGAPWGVEGGRALPRVYCVPWACARPAQRVLWLPCEGGSGGGAAPSAYTTAGAFAFVGGKAKGLHAVTLATNTATFARPNPLTHGMCTPTPWSCKLVGGVRHVCAQCQQPGLR